MVIDAVHVMVWWALVHPVMAELCAAYGVSHFDDLMIFS